MDNGSWPQILASMSSFSGPVVSGSSSTASPAMCLAFWLPKRQSKVTSATLASSGLLGAKPRYQSILVLLVSISPCTAVYTGTQLTIVTDGIWFSEDREFPGYRLELRGVKIRSSNAYEDVRFTIGRPGNWTGLCRVAHEMERIRICAFGEIDPEADEMSAVEMKW